MSFMIFVEEKREKIIISIFVESGKPNGLKADDFFHPLQILAGPFVKVVLALAPCKPDKVYVELLLYRVNTE